MKDITIKNMLEVLAEKVTGMYQLVLIELKVSLSSEHIEMVIDGEKDITLKVCEEVNRKMQEELEKLNLNFSVTVSTFGAFEIFKHPVQFRKNIGRNVFLKLKSGKEIEGVLKNYSDNKMDIEVTERKNKEKGKGKITQKQAYEFSQSDIEFIKVKPSF
jgi:ribosome maturation factor RimP